MKAKNRKSKRDCFRTEVPNVDSHHPIHWNPQWNKNTKEGWICSLPGCMSWALISCLQCAWFSGLQSQTGIYSIGSLALRPSNCSPGFPGSSACRPQIVGLLGLHNHRSQIPIGYFSLENPDWFKYALEVPPTSSCHPDTVHCPACYSIASKWKQLQLFA